MVKKYELKEMDQNKLKERLVDLRKELIRLNAQVSTGTTPENPGNLKNIKKNIARILTYIHTKKFEVKKETKKSIKEEKKELLKPKKCSRCKKENPVEAHYCNCGMALDLKTAMEDEDLIKEETNKTFQALIEIAKNPQLMKEFEEFRKNYKS